MSFTGIADYLDKLADPKVGYVVVQGPLSVFPKFWFFLPTTASSFRPMHTSLFYHFYQLVFYLDPITFLLITQVDIII